MLAMPESADAISSPSANLRVEVFRSFSTAAPEWRLLERSGVLTPYQRLDWMEAVYASAGDRQARLALAVIRSGDRPLALLPLEVEDHLGFAHAQFIGSEIGNSDWMVIDRQAAGQLTPDALRAVFSELGAVAGIDCLSICNQPGSWQGVGNPLLAFPHQPAPDHFYCGPLAPDKLNAKQMRNLRRGKRRLEEAFGPVVLRRAETEQDIDTIAAEFLRQRDIRFAEMGMPNVFADAQFQTFFRTAALSSLGQKSPALGLHALYAGESIVATAYGTYCGSHYSQYINSTANGPAAKYSLIGVLMVELMEELAADGIASIDFGLGDFEYKTQWTDKTEVFDSVIALTGRGRLLVPLLSAARRLKRAVKQTPALWQMAKRVRRMASRRDGSPAADQN